MTYIKSMGESFIFGGTATQTNSKSSHIPTESVIKLDINLGPYEIVRAKKTIDEILNELKA